MKKLLLIICAFFLFLAFMCVEVKAEEVVDDGEPVVVETEPADAVEDENIPLTEEEFKASLEVWLSQYLEESLVIKIITWLVDAGVLSALFVVWIKYNKYKNTTIGDIGDLVKSEVGKYLTENFKNLSETEISKIKDALDTTNCAIETMMKALVLSQDATTKGKVALIEFLGEHTKSDEVKTTVTEVKENLEKQQEVEKEVKDKVANDYESIF